MGRWVQCAYSRRVSTVRAVDWYVGVWRVGRTREGRVGWVGWVDLVRVQYTYTIHRFAVLVLYLPGSVTPSNQKFYGLGRWYH